MSKMIEGNEMSDKSELSSGVFLQTLYMTYLEDLVAAILCSQIHYWYSPSKNGNSKLRVHKQGEFWIAKSRRDWSDETGLTDAQIRRGLDVLVKKGVIEKWITPFNGAPTMHIRAIQISGKVLKDGEYLVPNVIGKKSPVQTANPLVTGAESLALQHQPLVTDDQSITESTQEIVTKTTQNSLASEDAGFLKPIKPNLPPEEDKSGEVVDMVKKNQSIELNIPSEAISPTPAHEVWHQQTLQYAKEYGE